jgi:hypothetical protein
MYLLNNASNFIESGWLVNKFPDELNRMTDAMNYVKSTEINANTSALTLSDLLDRINYRIERINFCIEAMEEERNKVHLPPLKYSK